MGRRIKARTGVAAGQGSEESQDVLRTRRAKVLALLAQTAGDPAPTNINRLLAALRADGFRVSRATFYRDLVAIRAEIKRRLADRNPVEFLAPARAQFQLVIRNLWEELRRIDDATRLATGGLSPAQAFRLRKKTVSAILKATNGYIALQQMGLIPPAQPEPGHVDSQIAISIIVDAIQRMNPEGSEERTWSCSRR